MSSCQDEAWDVNNAWQENIVAVTVSLLYFILNGVCVCVCPMRLRGSYPRHHVGLRFAASKRR